MLEFCIYRTVKEENMEQEGSTVLYVTEDSTVLHVTGNESLSTLPNIESCFQLLDSLEARYYFKICLTSMSSFYSYKTYFRF